MRGFLLIVLTLMAGLSAGRAASLEIKETRWGFDGRVLPGRFNILSVLVANPRPTAFEGEIALIETRGGESRVGAPYAQAVYLAPNTARYVQFHPLVTQDNAWRLRWGNREGETYELDAPAQGAPACVLLIEPDGAFTRSAPLKTFPDDLFPTTAAATEALDALVLDHVPRWEAARREAFLDWLRRGGTVHLARGAKGEHARFSEDLAVLNTAASTTPIGSGRVVRHEVTPAEMPEKYLADRGFPARELKRSQNPALYNFDATVLQRLAAMTQPEIAWWMIYLLSASYIFVVGPGHYFWGRTLDYRVSIAVFLGIVALYAAAFVVAGRRGADERQSVHSIATAHALGGGRFDVTQWISAFVTRGDNYRLTHEAPANLYSTAPQFESVNGKIRSGREGALMVNMPLYSSRPFMHRAVMSGDDTSMLVVEWKTRLSDDSKLRPSNPDSSTTVYKLYGELEALTLEPGSKFPKSVKNIWVRHREHFYALEPKGQLWHLSSGAAQPLNEFFSREQFQEIQNFNYDRHRRSLALDAGWFAKTSRALVAHSLGGVEGFQQFIRSSPPPDTQLQLFIFARAPESFALKGATFSEQNAWVLYRQDVWKDQKATSTVPERPSFLVD